jgi:predicted DNA-binding transcriptional regulator AlpA
MSAPVHLIDGAEAARILGVSRERIGQLVERGRAPEPIAFRNGAPLWSRAQVLLWARARERDRESKGTPDGHT